MQWFSSVSSVGVSSVAASTVGSCWIRFCCFSLCWVSLCCVSLYWVSLGWPGAKRRGSQSPAVYARCLLGRCLLGRCLLAGLLLAGAAGCQQRVASQLQGRWEGRPDTAAARAEREAERFGKVSADLVSAVSKDEELTGHGLAGKGMAGKESIGELAVGKEIASAEVTDWESYEVTIVIDFVSTDLVELSLGGEQPQSGRWNIVSTSPTGCTIEVQRETEDANTEQPTVDRRRFELLMDQREGACVGFLLTEAGADRQQGAIYFQRPRRVDAARKN